MLTKEQQFAALAFNIANVDGSFDESEIKKIFNVAKANNLNGDDVLAALKKELDNPSNVKEVANSVREDDKDLMIFACLRVAVADGVIAIKEIQRLHTINELFGYGPQNVTIEFVQQLKKNPNLKVEGIDF